MRKRMNTVIKAVRGNSGSGIVLVLVCILCVSVLGTLLLYLSYTGFMLKVTERQSKADIYDATAAMDEIRAGLQQASSDSIAEAYKTALINYSNPGYISDIPMEKHFQSEFINNLKKWKNNDGDSLLYSSGTYSGSYNTAALAKFTQGAVVSNDVGVGPAYFTEKSVTLKGVCVTYTDSKGYTTSVTSDISISAPSFNYIVSNYSVSGLQSYALIAKTALKSGETGSSTVTGSVYAGAIYAINDVTMDKGTVVCEGDAGVGYYIENDTKVCNPGKLTMGNEINLWVGGLKVERSSALSLNGNSYVYNDLELAGLGAQSSLSGSYYGFGNSDTKALESSAILVNGRDTTLNMCGLNQLMLAGHSFISDANMNKTGATDIIMGESASVKGNQMAYLVPVDCLACESEGVSLTNPMAYDGSVQPAVSLKETAEINGKPLSQYGISLKTVIANWSAEQHRAYYFMQFDTPDHANEFFKDYFAAHKATITEYLNEYTKLTSATGTVKSAGYMLRNANGAYQIVPLAGEFSNSSQQMISTFQQLTTTLFEPENDTGNDNPYDFFANTEKLAELPANSPKYFGGAGVVVNGNYTIDGTLSNLRVVIASGDVTVNSNFNGLIISGGTIRLADGVTLQADDPGVTAAFAVTDAAGDALGAYLRHGVSDTGKTENQGDNTGWNMDKLVSYSNWKKN